MLKTELECTLRKALRKAKNKEYSKRSTASILSTEKLQPTIQTRTNTKQTFHGVQLGVELNYYVKLDWVRVYFT